MGLELYHSAGGHDSAPPAPARADAAGYSTVTDLARLRGWSTSRPSSTATS